MTRSLIITFAILAVAALLLALLFGNAMPATESDIDKVDQWDMPDVLKEISGIVYMEEGRFACIQDEKGIIFIVNAANSEIEKKIPFAGKGDYEDIALSGNTAYVLRSDGKIFEVADISQEKPAVVEHDTPLTEDHNLEGMCFDGQNNRLLLAIKGSEPEDKEFKGIYAFDLVQKKMNTEPAFTINLKDAVFESLDEKDIQDHIRPSGIAIHPVSGDIYITEGSDPKIIIMDGEGKIKNMYPLDKDIYKQPEGISFSPEGQLYISNEGSKKTPGNIMKIKIQDGQP